MEEVSVEDPMEVESDEGVVAEEEEEVSVDSYIIPESSGTDEDIESDEGVVAEEELPPCHGSK